MVTVVRLGYYSFVMDSGTAQVIAAAAARGDIKECDINYIDKAYKVKVKSPATLEVQTLEQIFARDAEILELKEQIKKLEGSQNA